MASESLRSLSGHSATCEYTYDEILERMRNGRALFLFGIYESESD
jgi:hypothetical protein